MEITIKSEEIGNLTEIYEKIKDKAIIYDKRMKYEYEEGKYKSFNVAVEFTI